jgi:hypothetical protein
MVIQIKPEERAALIKMTTDPIPDAYEYCRACWTMVSDPSQCAQLLKGLAQIGFRSVGVQDPSKYANQYYDFFVKNAKKKG